MRVDGGLRGPVQRGEVADVGHHRHHARRVERDDGVEVGGRGERVRRTSLVAGARVEGVHHEAAVQQAAYDGRADAPGGTRDQCATGGAVMGCRAARGTG